MKQRSLAQLRHGMAFKFLIGMGAMAATVSLAWGLFYLHAFGFDTPPPSRTGAFHLQLIFFTLLMFAAMAATLYFMLRRMVLLPIRRIIAGAGQMADGEHDSLLQMQTKDEIGRLAQAIHRMGQAYIGSQHELHRQKNEYQRLFELVPCIISLQDRQFRLIGYNREFRDHFDPTLGDYCYHAYKGRHEKCENCPVEKTFADGQAHYSEETGRSKDGATTHWIVKTAPMRNEHGEIIGAMEISLDVTHRKALENKLAQSELKLIQAAKMATLGEMAAGIAHELNQPLTVIKGAGNYFMKKIRKQQPIAPAVLAEMATEIDSHVDRASNIINQLRQFGRKSSTAAAPVQINTILQNAFEMFRQQLILCEIAVEWRLAADLPLVLAEAGRMEQVFVNLLLNAKDAIEAKWRDGPVAQDETKRITIDTQVQANQVTARIRDNGVGVPAHCRDRVFEPFYTTKKVGEGTGLGLSISYGIIKDFGGTIQIDSVPMQYTCFTLCFPIKEDHDRQGCPPIAADSG